MADPTFDTDAAHHWFARTTNNAVWNWLEANQSGAPADPIAHAAHASYFHWSHIGSDVQRARAASLVANVHATLGNTSLASGMAEECLRLLESAADDATDWDHAFGLDSLARAQAASGHRDADATRERARTAGDVIQDPQDKAVFDDWFARSNGHRQA